MLYAKSDEGDHLTTQLILASGSPRRQEMLKSRGYDFTVHSADIDESISAGEDAAEYAQRLARQKAEAVGRQHPDAAILAADTIVVCGGCVLGKPESRQDACGMLRMLAGRVHQVHTAVCLAPPLESGLPWAETVTTNVHFRELSHQEVEAYVATDEPLDKAGAYAIQGGAARFVTRIEGSYCNVIGFPMVTVERMLAQLGIFPRMTGSATGASSGQG
jgi:septum formation protein